MDKGSSSHHQIVLKSILNPDQVLLHNLFTLCGVKIEPKTLITVFKLVDLGIPAESIVALLHDVARHAQRDRPRKLSTN